MLLLVIGKVVAVEVAAVAGVVRLVYMRTGVVGACCVQGLGRLLLFPGSRMVQWDNEWLKRNVMALTAFVSRCFRCIFRCKWRYSDRE